MSQKRPSLSTLFVMLILLMPTLIRCQSVQKMMPELLYRQVEESIPTPTPRPALYMKRQAASERESVPAATTSTALPTATPKAVRLYNPPPAVNPERLAPLGAGRAARGVRSSSDLSLLVGSFSKVREPWDSFWQGGGMRLAARILQAEYPEIQPLLFDELTPENMAQVDLFILTAAELSENELAALRSFVEGGGWLLAGLSPIDTAYMDGQTKTEPARQIAAIFGLEVLPERPPQLTEETLYATLVEPEHHRLMNEPWGEVETLFVMRPLSFGDLGPFAKVIALNGDAKPAVVSIESGKLSAGAGMVLFVDEPLLSGFHVNSKGNFISNDALSRADNDVFIYNFIDLALQAKAYRHGDISVPDPASPHPAQAAEPAE